MKDHNCRVCGLYIEDKPWGEDGRCPTYEFCPCCGVEFGYQDYSLESIREFRKNWLEKDARWDDPKSKPSNWNLEKQMQDIHNEYK